MKKVLILLIATLQCFAGYVCDPSNPCDPRNPCDACNDCCAPCPDFNSPEPPCESAYNAPYLIEPICDSDFYASISFLYWQAREDNLEPGALYSRKQDASSNNEGCEENRIFAMDYCFNPAFKIAVGLTFDCDNWEFFADYTWYHYNTGKSKEILDISTPNFLDDEPTPPYTYLMPYFTQTLSQFGYVLTPRPITRPFHIPPKEIKLTSKWKVSFDMISAEMARSYYVGKCLVFKTHFGGKGVFLDQQYNQCFIGAIQQPARLGKTIITNNTFKTCSWGAGPTTGINTDWKLCGNVVFYANASASILYTNYNITGSGQEFLSSNDVNDNGNVEEAFPLNAKFPKLNICAVTPQLEMNMGFGWEDYINCNRYFLSLKVGYDALVFFSQNVFPKFDRLINTTTLDSSTAQVKLRWFSDINSGNFYLHGLNISARLDF